MQLQVYVGHSGRALVTDVTKVATLDALRAFIASHAEIQPNRQVLLTVKGKSVRQQTLATETELYVFDSSLLSSSASTADLSAHAVHIPPPAPLNTGDPPDTIANQTDLQAWQDLFHNRLTWARRQREQCAAASAAAQEALAQQLVIQRGLGVALDSLKLHLKGADQKHASAASWADELLADQEHRMNTWENDSRLLATVPAKAEFARFIQYSQGTEDTGQDVYLDSLLPFEQVQRAASRASHAMDVFKRRVASMKSALAEAKKHSTELFSVAELVRDNSDMEASMEPDKLMEEIDIVLGKITSDDTHVNTLLRTSQSVSQASKMALLHTRNHLPNLQEYSREMEDLVRKTFDQRNDCAETCMQHMQTLSRIESHLSRVLAEVKALEISQDDQEAFNTLNIASRLPYVYGQLLIEALRRREWADKMSKDSATLLEEMANYQDEERRRRQRWLNNVDDVVQTDLARSRTLGIDIANQVEADPWPYVTRHDIESYIATLASLQTVPAEVTQELTLALKSVELPTKRQVKHAKAFLAGSMHEAAFGSASLAVRGDDEQKVLRDANTKLEEELRSHRSRIRKLEDLLHRQTSVSRAVSGDVFTPGLDLVGRTESTSPAPSIHSRRPSEDSRLNFPGSRRASSNRGTEEKRLARRLVTLEEELQVEKERNVNLEKEAAARKEALEKKMRKVQEAESIKQDIMSNLDAQGREFAIERRGLEQELSNVKARVEELEDELDRVLGSRDVERSGIDARARALEDELAKMTERLQVTEKEKATHATEAQTRGEADEARITALQKQLQDAVAAKDGMQLDFETTQKTLAEYQQSQKEHMDALMTVHGQLDPKSSPPESFAGLVSAIGGLAGRTVAHVKDLAEAVTMTKSNADSLILQREAHETELTEAKRTRETLEAENVRVNEQLAAASARADMLATQLEDEREQLRTLRGKFGDGETGIDALRQQVEDQEDQIGKLMEQVTEAKSHETSLDVELMRLQSKLKTAENNVKSTQARMETRAVRAKEITSRVFAQNARLMRLLETLGFAITHKDGQMVIERASKVSGASTTLTEPSQFLSRAVSLSSAPTLTTIRKMSDPATDPDPSLAFLHWPDFPSVAAEDAAYTQLLSQLSLFNIDAFSDAIAKRLRDFEYTARKFRLESRNALSKATKASHDASSKLAVRDFKEGDLALFLPTKGKAIGAWAAFNINAPHHFLREKESMALAKREWLVARISKIEERTVDLSKSTTAQDGNSLRSAEGDDNPFDLSDGLTWYLVHATEERPGAPATPGLGKSTVQASVASASAERVPRNEEARGVKDLKAVLGRSLSSRRSSSTSKRSVPVPVAAPVATARVEVGSPQTGGSLIAAGLGMLKREDKARAHKPETAPEHERNEREGRGEERDSSPKKPRPGSEEGWRRIWSLDYGA